MSQTIVVPLDGSDLAERAIPWATVLARTLGHSVTLVQIIPWPLKRSAGIMDVYISQELAERIRNDTCVAAGDYLKRICAQLASEGIEAHSEVVVGPVVETILDIADEHGASTIVMASHGHGGLTRLMTGSMTQQVLHQSLVPVLVVRSGVAAPSKPALRSLLVPVDGSLLSESAIELATSLAGAGTSIILARVIEPFEVPVTSGVEAGAIMDWKSTEEASRDAQQYLDRLAGALNRSGVQTTAVLRMGRIGNELRTLADEHHVDLIVMPTHGRTGLDRVMLGSVADDLARHAQQPVLIVSAHSLTARMMGPFMVRDVMSRDVASVSEDEPLAGVVRKLLRRRVSGAPVINAAGELVGVVSEHDLIDWHARYIAGTGKDESMLNPEVYGARMESDQVRSVMTSPPITVEADAPLPAAMHLLVHHRLRRLPVVQEGRLVGILTRSDALAAIDRREAEVAAVAGPS
ncbi:MAG: universal stress protein [Chloroflexota bacterium]